MTVKVTPQYKEGTNNKLLCRDCRHANHGTYDYEEKFVACKFSGGLRYSKTCDQMISTARGTYYLYEAFDNTNCTWFSDEDFEIIFEEL